MILSYPILRRRCSPSEHATPLVLDKPYRTEYGRTIRSGSAAEDKPGSASLSRQRGVVEQAHVELSTNLNLYRDMAMTFWLPGMEATLAQVEST